MNSNEAVLWNKIWITSTQNTEKMNNKWHWAYEFVSKCVLSLPHLGVIVRTFVNIYQKKLNTIRCRMYKRIPLKLRLLELRNELDEMGLSFSIPLKHLIRWRRKIDIFLYTYFFSFFGGKANRFSATELFSYGFSVFQRN